MKYLITGGAGFIGSNFMHYMTETYPEDMFVCIDALTYAGNYNNIKELAHMTMENNLMQADFGVDSDMKVFDTFPDVVMPLVEKKVAKKYVYRKPSFVFVDDKIVTEAMKYHFGIKLPEPGKGYQYGLKEHSWQALAAAAYLMLSTS